MLEGFETSGRHTAASGRPGRFRARVPSLPHAVVDVTRDRWKDRVPSAFRSGHDARSAGSKQPLVAARYEEVTAEVGQGDVLAPETVDTIHAKEHAARVVPIRIDL